VRILTPNLLAASVVMIIHER